MPGADDYREKKLQLYRKSAQRAISHTEWKELKACWGTKLIEATARGITPFSISYPAANVATRVNIHLMRQLYRDKDLHKLSDEEDWEDDSGA